MLAGLLLCLIPCAGGEASARWSCAPDSVEVGQPFELLLELEHPAGIPASSLVESAPVLDQSWVVLAPGPARGEPAGEGRLRTVMAWRVASLEPGRRSLAEALSSVSFSADVTRIQVGAAEVLVRGVLLADEDTPRPLREFPEGFALGHARGPVSRAWLWGSALGVVLAATGAAAFAWRRRAARASRARPATPLERLAELEGWIDSERGREGCYRLTRLLREATERARAGGSARERAGLTDEEWLAGLQAARDVPQGALQELAAVFERAARVKYAGEAPSSWALEETFARARVALQAVGAGGAP